MRNLGCKLSTELSELKQEVHGSSQVVKKLKTDTQHKWKFEGHSGGADHATLVDHCLTGGASARTTQRALQLQLPKPSQNEEIKDEYIFECNHNERYNLTDDFYEYEQGQADIIVKGRF